MISKTYKLLKILYNNLALAVRLQLLPIYSRMNKVPK